MLSIKYLKHYLHRVAAILLLSAVSGPLMADNSKTFDNYDVYYSVVNSTFIQPDIAGHYGIIRGKDRALLNIAIRKRQDNGQTTAQAVEISGTSSDFIHSLPLQFKEVRERDAIYYIAQFTFTNHELRSFTINIKPDAEAAAYTLKFSKVLYRDE